MRKAISVWLLAWMAVFAFGQEVLFAQSVTRANGGSVSVSATVVNAKSKAVKPQVRDTRISQQEILALINMDPVDPDYRTNYETHETGVILVPSPGPTQGKKGWYADLAIPAGTLMDIPRGARREAFTFAAPNGETAEAVKVFIPEGQMTIVNACGNGHRPRQAMIMKMLEPRIETKEISVARLPFDLCKNIDGLQERVPVGYQLDSNGNCVQPFEPALVRERRIWPWVAGGLGLLALGLVFGGGGDKDDDCETCPDRIPKPAP